MTSQISQNQNAQWYPNPNQQQQSRMLGPGNQRQINPQVPRSTMLMNQNSLPINSSNQQQQYTNQRFWGTAAQQQNAQTNRLPGMTLRTPMNRMNAATTRFINTNATLINNQNDSNQEMFYQQSDYSQQQMNQQTELNQTPDQMGKYADNL